MDESVRNWIRELSKETIRGLRDMRIYLTVRKISGPFH